MSDQRKSPNVIYVGDVITVKGLTLRVTVVYPIYVKGDLIV